jgi:hypothetical protein
LFPEDAVLCLEVVDDVPLLLVDPAREHDDEELDGVGKRGHGGEGSRGRQWSRTSRSGKGTA